MADEMPALPCFYCYVYIISIRLNELFLFKPPVVEVNLVKNIVNADKIRKIINEYN